MTEQFDLFGAAPPPLPAPLPPLSDDDLAAAAALDAIAAGEAVEHEMVRHLIGVGLLHVTTTRFMITEDGEALRDRAGGTR